MSKKLSRVFLLTAILIVSLCTSAFVAITQTRSVSAANADFTMVDGAALRISDDDGGIRFRVKMNAATANKFKNGDAELKIAIAPKAIFATVTDGNYAELSQKIELTADKNKIYQDGDYYYANGVITNILEENRKLDFCAVAYYTEGNNTVYAAFNADNTCGNVYDIVNQLVVSYGDTYADDILKCKSYEWYGVGDYPILINTIEQYNALAAQVNNGRDFSKYTAVIADEVKSASGKTEITNAEKFPTVKEEVKPLGRIIDECFYSKKEAISADEVKKLGFETAYTTTVSGIKEIDTNCQYYHGAWAGMSSTDITGYEKVLFAVKSNEGFRFNTAGYVETTDWLTFTLTQNADATWNIVVVNESGTTVHSANNLKGSTLLAILWTNVTTGYYPRTVTVGKVLSVWATEVRGIRKTNGELVAELLFTGATESSAAVPAGYANVYTFTSTDGKVQFNDIDVSAYSILTFEFGLTQWAQFAYPAEAVFYATSEGETTKVTMSRKDVSTWDITFSGNKVLDANNKYVDVTITRSGNNIKELFGDMFCGSGAVFTITELRGEIDNRYNTNSAKWTESHWFETEDTENYMLKDGQTEYTVVIPSAPSGMINYAKEELNAFFLKQRG